VTTKASILQAIRQKCLDCSCHQPGEVRACHIIDCTLWPFRFGSDPSPSANRGFAKSSLHTGDSLHKPPSGHSGSPAQVQSRKSPVYTDCFAQADAFPPSRSARRPLN